MRKVKFRDWEFEANSELTRKTYEKQLIGSSDDCICEFCENYRMQRKSIFPVEIKFLFDNLGIDFRKEAEVSEYGDIKKGLPKYCGCFHFAGKIIKGEDCKRQIDENHWHIKLVEIDKNFKVGFTNGRSLSFFDKEVNLVQVEFETDIPWILKNTEDLLDHSTAQRDETDAPTVSLSELEKEFEIQ